MKDSPHRYRTDPDTLEKEHALVRCIAEGDRNALCTLYGLYHRRLCRFLSRMTSRPDIIEEVINDTMWIVWQKAGGFRGEAKVSTWIMSIAYRCALKPCREQVDLSLDEAGDALLQAGHDPGAEREVQDWLRKALDRLPAVQRIVLELAYGAGHSIDEIAAIMECPVGTVKARLFSARVKLRNQLSDLADPAPGPIGGAA